MPNYVRVTNLSNDRQLVRVNNPGPYTPPGHISI
ncbi:hypothetical protein [Sodalis sp.]